MLHHTIEKSISLHNEMNIVYVNYVDHLVTDLTTSMQMADQLFTHLCNDFVMLSDFDDTTIESIELLVRILDVIGYKLTHFDKALNVTGAYASQLFPKRLTNTTTCLAARKKLITTLSERRIWLEGFLTNSSTFDGKTDMVKVSEARSLLSNMSRCLQAYKHELDEFSTWLNSIRLPMIAVATMNKTRLEVFDVDGIRLRDLMLGFINGSMTKSEMTRQFLTQNDRQTTDSAQQLSDHVKQSVFEQLESSINEIAEWMKSFFSKLFRTYVSFQKYMEVKDTRIETVARTLDIWRHPTVNFQSSQVSTSTHAYQ